MSNQPNVSRWSLEAQDVKEHLQPEFTYIHDIQLKDTTPFLQAFQDPSQEVSPHHQGHWSLTDAKTEAGEWYQ